MPHISYIYYLYNSDREDNMKKKSWLPYDTLYIHITWRLFRFHKSKAEYDQMSYAILKRYVFLCNTTSHKPGQKVTYSKKVNNLWISMYLQFVAGFLEENMFINIQCDTLLFSHVKEWIREFGLCLTSYLYPSETESHGLLLEMS